MRQEKFNPVSSTRTVGRNSNQHPRRISWVSVAEQMGKNPQAHRRANEYIVRRKWGDEYGKVGVNQRFIGICLQKDNGYESIL